MSTFCDLTDSRRLEKIYGQLDIENGEVEKPHPRFGDQI